MKNPLIIATFMVVSATTHAGGAYDDSYLERKTGYESDVVQFNESNVSRVDLSRGQPSINRKETALEQANEEALKAVSEAQRLIAEAENIRNKAQADYDAKMKRVAEESRLVRQEYESRMDRADHSTAAMNAATRSRLALAHDETELRRSEVMTDPNIVRNEFVDLQLGRLTLKEAAQTLMPEGWVVVTDFSRQPDLDTRLFMFGTTDRRDAALQQLVAGVRGVRVTYQYFFDLVKDGKPAPMLLISDRKVY